MTDEITLPGGQKIPPWVAIATAAGAFLLVIIGSGGGKKTAQTTAADKVLITEYQQRLKEQRDESEQWREDQEDIYKQWVDAQAMQWEEYKKYLDNLLVPLQKPMTKPIALPSDGQDNPDRPPINPINPILPPRPGRPKPPMPPVPPPGNKPPHGGGYAGLSPRIGAQFFDNLLYGYEAQVPKINPLAQTDVKRGYL
jgi:hypothetical protein